MQKRGKLTSSKTSRHGHGKKLISRSAFISAVVVMLIIMVVFIFLSVSIIPLFMPSDQIKAVVRVTTDKRSLSEKLVGWIPRHHLNHLAEHELQPDEPPPLWDREFWTPIDFDPESTTVTLCKLDFQTYSSSPHLYPMFRDLEMLSKCMGGNRRRDKLKNLLEEIKSSNGTLAGRVIEPSGFVFHESRVGSTLVANEFGSDPWSLVFSESAPTANALLHCERNGGCDRKKEVQMFRDIVTLMGRSPFHKRLFFKFQSITSTRMEIALEAFPNTSWAYVFREPIQTMMSHLDPAKGSLGSPCLRSMRDPPKKVTDALAAAVRGSYRSTPKEAWCAAHLSMLCNYAIENYQKYKTKMDAAGNTVQRALLIHYDSLPGIIPKVFLPMCGSIPSATWVRKMIVESSFYSKGRGRRDKFTGDSQDKEQRATEAIQQYAKSILEPPTVKLNTYFMDSLNLTAPDLYDAFSQSKNKGTTSADWILLKSFPALPDGRSLISRPTSTLSSRISSLGTVDKIFQSVSSDSNRDSFMKAQTAAVFDSADPDLDAWSTRHSNIVPKVPYLPWSPFSNSHDSKPFETIRCPASPEAGYPKTFFMTKITDNWNTDSTVIPPFHYDTLCHFDYQNREDQKKAFAYRKAEVPFVVYNIPEVDDVVNKWNDIDYLHRRLGQKQYRTETSKDNHFMYWSNGGRQNLRGPEGKKWTQPTNVITETFEKWLETATKGQNKTLETRQHEYFRVSSDMGNMWIFDELPFFQPKESLFIVEPSEQRGIHCRFGMRSVIAEAHFDGSRNYIAILGGLRRYLLTHPDQCKNMHMLPMGHPSGRHSAIDWSKPNVKQFPNWLKVRGNEVILQPGDMLYLPTYWIHYIISLNVNYQCNTRSGRTSHFDKDIRECGF